MERLNEEILPAGYGSNFNEWNWHDLTEEYANVNSEYIVEAALLYCHDFDWEEFDFSLSNVKCSFDFGWVVLDDSSDKYAAWCAHTESLFLVNDAITYSGNDHLQDLEEAMCWVEANIARD